MIDTWSIYNTEIIKLDWSDNNIEMTFEIK